MSVRTQAERGKPKRTHVESLQWLTWALKERMVFIINPDIVRMVPISPSSSPFAKEYQGSDTDRDQATDHAASDGAGGRFAHPVVAPLAR